MTNDRSDLCPELLDASLDCAAAARHDSACAATARHDSVCAATTRRCTPRAGVTLIEMLVVVTIIALFAAIVGPRLLHRGDQARVVAAKQQIDALQLALGQYKLDTGTFPTTPRTVSTM